MTLPHLPTEQTKARVMIASGRGVPHELIAKLVGIDSRDTLYKYYRHEIDIGFAERSLEVTGRLAEKIDNGDAASIMFYLKTRLGWREKDQDDTTKELIHVIKRIIVDGAATTDA